jgi:hypothetical protein
MPRKPQYQAFYNTFLTLAGSAPWTSVANWKQGIKDGSAQRGVCISHEGVDKS